MCETIVRVFMMSLILSTAMPSVASAGNAGCGRRDRSLVYSGLTLALAATPGGFVFRRRRIDWGDTSRDQ